MSILSLWQSPPEGLEEARQAFAARYADPVEVNGQALTLSHLIDRARWLQSAFDDLRFEVLEQVAIDQTLVIAFVLKARHTGPFMTSLGVVPATGMDVAIRTIDVLTLQDGLITRVNVVSDELQALSAMGVVSLHRNGNQPAHDARKALTDSTS